MMTEHLGWLAVAVAAVAAAALCCTGCGPPVVAGAIRWDAWTGGRITEQVERTLGPARYHHRLPWFAEVTGPDRVRIDGGRDEVMRREIRFAAEAGLDYWAFLIYPRGSPMSVALRQYLRCSDRDRINFCVILHASLNVPDEQWPDERRRLVDLLALPTYQTVLGGRPLVYAFSGRSLREDRFADFVAAARRAGRDPYCVYMGWRPSADYATWAGRGFDAVANYARAGDQPTYAELVAGVEQDYWQDAVAGGAAYVPLVTTGWDKRPRQDHPVSWEPADRAYHRQQTFPSMAAADEIAAHLRRALAFVDEHAETCPARAVIIYAWNEYDEGGWLAPTRGSDGRPDTARLDAIQTVLAAQRRWP